MRCPKCGYISFDHLEVCLKCKKNIKVTSDALQGGVLNVVAPIFLNLQPQEDQSGEYDPETEDETMVGDFDIVVDEESAEEVEDEVILDMGQDEGEDRGSANFDISLDEEMEQEITIDPSLFDNDSQFQDQNFDNQIDHLTEKSADDFEIEMPEDLMDMSDLAPPVPSEDSKPSVLDSPEELDSLSIDLDGLDFDLDSDIPASDKLTRSVVREENVLPLADIDFSDTISGPGKKGNKKSGAMDMDEDLNFDLDLDGLSIHDDI